MRVSFNIGKVLISASSSGGIRIGGKFGKTYLSTQVAPPSKSKRTKKEVGFEKA